MVESKQTSQTKSTEKEEHPLALSPREMRVGTGVLVINTDPTRGPGTDVFPGLVLTSNNGGGLLEVRVFYRSTDVGYHTSVPMFHTEKKARAYLTEYPDVTVVAFHE